MASAVIGALRANLGLDSAQFHKGASDAQRSLEALRGRFLVVAGAAAGLATGLGALGRSTINTGSEINKLAQLSNAMPEEFQRWAAGAASVGIEQEKLGDILKDVNDRVGDFVTTGGGPMLDFFEQIGPKVGVTAKDFANLSGPQALQLYVSSLEKAGVSQQEMTFYMEAMASDATALIPLLQNGGAAMAAMGDRAEQLGSVFDNKTVAALARAKIAVSEAGTVMSSFGSQIGAAVAPMIEQLATAFVNLSVQGAPIARAVALIADNLDRLIAYVGVAVIGFGTHYVAALVAARLATMSLAGSLAFLRGAIMRTGVGLLVIGAAELVLALGRIVTKVGGVGAAMEIMGRVAAGVWKGIGIAAGAVPLALESVWQSILAGFFTMIGDMQLRWYKFIVALGQGALSAGMTEVAATFGAYAESVGTSLDETTAAADAASAAAAAAGEAAKGALTDGLETARAAAAELAAEVKRTGEDAAGAAGGVDTLGDGLDDLGGGGAGGGGKASKAQEALKGLREELTRLSDTMRMTEAQERVYNAIRDAGVTATSAEGQEIGRLVPEIDRLTQAKEGLRSAASAMKSSLQGAFTGLVTRAQSFNDGLMNIIGSLAEMAANAAFRSLWNSVSGNAMFAGIGKIFGFANGTPYAPGGLATVNERGGEIINLPRGSQVIPHDISKEMARDAAGGGGSTVQVVPSAYFDVVVQQGAARVAAPMVGGAMRAQSRGYGARQSSYDMRGTTT